MNRWAVVTTMIWLSPQIFVNENGYRKDMKNMKRNLCAHFVARNFLQNFALNGILLITVCCLFVLSQNSDQKIFLMILWKCPLISGPDGSLIHKCDCCPNYFRTTEERDAHTTTEHNDTVICDICEKPFRSSKSLQWHNYICHRERVPTQRKKVAEFKCKYCGRKYYMKKGLDIHIAEHGKCERPVVRIRYSIEMLWTSLNVSFDIRSRWQPRVPMRILLSDLFQN